MITDQQTNTIYFSQKLEQVCPNLYHSISTLKEKGYPITRVRDKDCVNRVGGKCYS